MTIILKDRYGNFPNTADGIPPNYNFEIAKTLTTIHKLQPKSIFMQYPDGLLSYAPIIIDLIHLYFPDINITILNDVVYGACCVDDHYKCDLLIHYGHSCLISVADMNVRVLYIFVEIAIDIDHIVSIINKLQENKKCSIIGTIQFNRAVNKVGRMSGAVVPQALPLSRGEVLGCTSPSINTDICLYIGDGRFHLEAAMIKNRNVEFYKYCPFSKKVTREYYENDKMMENRQREIEKFYRGKRCNLGGCGKKCEGSCKNLQGDLKLSPGIVKNVGIILSGLGKQGNILLFNRVIKHLEMNGFNCYKIVIDEINEDILDRYSFCDAFVQIGCPRLSIDWGNTYCKPLLNSYEVLGEIGNKYEMDYYDKERNSRWGMYNRE